VAAKTVLAPALLLALLAAGCGGSRSAEERAESLRSDSEQEAWQAWEEEAGGDGASASEGDRTAAMEEHAADSQAAFEESMANATTDEERLRAYEEFEADRAELNRMAEDDGSSDEYAPPP
jgi:hypothetical protein